MSKLESAATELKNLLGLDSPPIAITFSQAPPEGIPRYGGSMPAPTPDGRTGTVPAGCVFWIKGGERTFHTCAEDHANCSVGSLTHGFKTLEEAAGGADIAALVECGWVSPEVFPDIPTVKQKPECVTYGPLGDAASTPDVVLLRLNGRQAMMLHDAIPGLGMEGKPQCHIIPIAKEEGRAVLSVGCMLSRVRTGMTNNEMTCAIPGAQIEDVLDKLKTATAADKVVAAYASEDSSRFGDYLDS